MPRSPVHIIVDTDLASDCDDAAALAVLHAMADRDECDILGIAINSTTPDAARAAAAINAYFGRAAIPVSQAIVGPNSPSHYVAKLAARPNIDSKALVSLSPMQLYRQVLAAQPDQSVTIISIGFLNNLSALLNSSADEYSNESGRELIAAKVIKLVVMGGTYPTSGVSSEFNFAGDIPAAHHVVTHWPTPITFTGYELGILVQSGSTLSKDAPADNPTRVAYEAMVGVGRGRASWDPLTVLYAVYGLFRDATVIFEAVTGTNTVDAKTGNNTFIPGPGKHQYLKLGAEASVLSSVLDRVYTQSPKTRATEARSAGHD